MAEYADPLVGTITIPNAGVDIPGWVNDPRGKWGDKGGSSPGGGGPPGVGEPSVGPVGSGVPLGALGTPTALEYGAAGVAAAGAAWYANPALWLGVGGMLWNAFAQLAAGNAAKQLAEFNAGIAELRAQDARLRGEEEAQRYAQGVRTLIGSQRAGYAAQNVDVGQGSPLDTQADAAFLGKLDERTIRVNAAREAWGYEVEAENFRRGGGLAQQEARMGAVSSIIGGTTSLLQAKYGWGRRT